MRAPHQATDWVVCGEHWTEGDLAERTRTPHVPRMPMSLTPPAPGPMTSDGDVLTLVSPISGVLVPLDAVPDPAFAQRLAGDGVSIDPLSDLVVAPCDALVRLVHRAGHAVTIEASGLEIVLHVGLDTVALGGEGFHPLVKSGDAVRAGDPLLRFDVDLVARRARSLLTEMLITNMDLVSALRPRSGRVVGGRDVVLEVSLHEHGPAATSTDNQVGGPASADLVRSAPIVVAAASGLHARPAAVVAATARRFAADVRLVKDGREANARSVVSIMALEVTGGDTVSIVARGHDAPAALAAIAEKLATDLDAGSGGQSTPSAPTARSTAPSADLPRAIRADGALVGVPTSPGIAVGQVFRLRQDDVVLEERGAEPAQEQR